MGRCDYPGCNDDYCTGSNPGPPIAKNLHLYFKEMRRQYRENRSCDPSLEQTIVNIAEERGRRKERGY